MSKEHGAMLILGSTGSVGEQAIDVARKEGVKISALSANANVKRVEEQVREFGVKYCAMADESAAKELKIKLSDTDTRVFSGSDGICEMIAEADGSVAVNSIIGQAGLAPTLAVIDSGKRLALANKESLVVAGDIVISSAKQKGVDIIPVDSEHCAIFQCMQSGKANEVKKILLTASGGPFYGRTKDQLEKITVEEALAHPTWKMGAKITIDSATLMNKGFEVIEAVHLFGVGAENVEVVVHKESIIHSMVEYIDNSVIAQMSVPDMRFCVQYAINYPERCGAVINNLDLFSVGALHFDRPDMETFSLLACAIDSIKRGGALPAILNAANEVAVAAFLNRKISFYNITESVRYVVRELSDCAKYTSLEDILNCDAEARRMANKVISGCAC